MPFVLYGVFRYIYLVDRGDGAAPDEILVRDRHILLTVMLYALTALLVLTLAGCGDSAPVQADEPTLAIDVQTTHQILEGFGAAAASAARSSAPTRLQSSPRDSSPSRFALKAAKMATSSSAT